MGSPLYNQLRQSGGGNGLLQQFAQFRKTFNGDPQQIIQQMLNSGRITQSQLNQYAEQANTLYQQFKGLV